MSRNDQKRLERLLTKGDQAAYEAELERLRNRTTDRAERQDVRRREEVLEQFLDMMDLD